MNTPSVKTKHMAVLVMCLAALFQACCSKTEQSPAAAEHAIAGQCVADTIIYSVVIKNPDPLDEWTDKCLSQLKRPQFVDRLFDAVYSHKARAYSYSTHKPLSVSDIKEIENSEEFSRDKVAKLQFWETWHFDEQTQAMHKKVQAILLAYEILSEEGELRGYKAAFYIKMNN